MGIHSITFSLIALGGLSAGFWLPGLCSFCCRAGATVLLFSTGWIMIRFRTIRELDGRNYELHRGTQPRPEDRHPGC
ncbi:MAG: hypothetical protein CM1200mP20_14160 [Pseudomonadota bacterium]|nr:MAG: hypothetical protein CM1200mP20_14160 [Pseudomonadota bacterium]